MQGFIQAYKTEILYVTGVVLLAAVLMGLMLNPFLTVVNHDSAIFCILAQSILKGNYLLVSEPNPQPYFTFPPLLSLQLAGLMLLFGNTDLQAMQWVFKGYIDLLFLCSLPLFYIWVRQMFSRRDAMILTPLVAVNPIIFKYSSDILSDTPYWASSMLAIFAVWQFQRTIESQAGKPLRWFFLAVVMIILCALTRQIGMALVMAFLTILAVRTQWKLLVTASLLFILTVGGWQSYEHFYRSQHRSDISSLNQQGVQEVLDKSPIKLEYVKHFLIDRPVDLDQNRLQTSPAVLLQNIADRVQAYTEMSLDRLLPTLKVKMDGHKVNLTHFAGFLLLFWVLFLPGLWRLFWRFPFGGLYLSVYMSVLLVYPYISPRFLLPVFPIILLCAYLGLLAVRDRLTQQVPRLKEIAPLVVPFFLVLALAGHLPDTIRWVHAGLKLKLANQGPSLRKGNRAYYETLFWIRQNTPESSLIISRKPPVTYFYSGRRSTAFPFTAHQDKLFAYIEEKRQRYGQEFPHIYIFEDNVFGSSTRYLKPTVEKYRDRLTLVYTEPVTHSRVWLLK
ncbi:MAG: hypothetical protein K0Q50_2534 [Vampirovibrio sp.]|jgi:hypothetical protein|nr:hypothetical protein [Vampirovibrio sp.]